LRSIRFSFRSTLGNRSYKSLSLDRGRKCVKLIRNFRYPNIVSAKPRFLESGELTLLDLGLKGKRIIVGIPAYNEETTIAKVIVRAKRYAERVVVVDDGSTDDTHKIAEALGAIVIGHKRNRGYGTAIGACFTAARNRGADILVTLDGDGQHDPDEIPGLVQRIVQGKADIVIGSRFLRPTDQDRTPKLRRVGISFLTGLTEVASRRSFSDAQSGFRAYSRRAIEQITPAEQGMGVGSEILMKAAEKGLKILEVPALVTYRGSETSTHNPVYHGLDVVASVIKFTSIRHPLVFYGGLGMISLSVAVGFGLWTLNIYTKEGRIVTNLLLISLGSALIGVLALFTAGILFTLISVLRGTTRLRPRESDQVEI